MYYKQVDKKYFMSVIEKAEFRTKDEEECISFGSKSVKMCLRNSIKDFNKYFLIIDDKDNDSICAYIIMPRDGYLSLFVSKNIKHHKSFVKTLHDLAEWYVNTYEDMFYVNTSNWYKEAIKINKLIGMDMYSLYDNYTTWIYSKNKYHRNIDG